MDNIYLMGADDVKTGGIIIRDAAIQMDRAANIFSESCDRLIRAMSEATEKMEQVVERLEAISNAG